MEQQSYKSCMGILKLANKHSAERLEMSCQKALSYTAAPSYKMEKSKKVRVSELKSRCS